MRQNSRSSLLSNSINMKVSAPQSQASQPIRMQIKNPMLQLTNSRPIQSILIPHDDDDEGYMFLREALSSLSNYDELNDQKGQYCGQMVNGLKHGKGLMIYVDGSCCEGYWLNDRKQGQCVDQYANGDHYEGEYMNGKQQGFGVYLSKSGEKYEGNWANGLKHGFAKWLGSDGDQYEGEWKLGKIEGPGTYITVEGDKYTGSFRGNMKHGRGIEHFKNGDVYNGEYQNGNSDGNGMYLWENGNEYRGQFKTGFRSGKGKWTKWATSDQQSYSYEGEYMNDKKHGQGIFIWPSGNRYQGTFLNDFRHGYGEMTWTDGSYYKGSWEKGQQHGKGELLKRGQGLLKGLFMNNVFINKQRQQQKNRSTKLIWENEETKKVDLSLCLDRSYNGDQSFNNALNNFMPSIAKKPLFLLYQPTNQVLKPLFVGKTGRIAEFSSFNLYPFDEDPDFTTILERTKPTLKKNVTQVEQQLINSLKCTFNS